MAKIIIKNYYNLTDEDMNSFVYRARAVIINSKDEILMGYCGNIYQFPGGHQEENETISEALIREVKEETGIDIEAKDYKPFYMIKYFNKDWPKEGINRYTEFNYFLIKTDQLPKLDEINLDEYEKENNFELRYLNINEVIPLLTKEKENNEKLEIIYTEITSVLEYYLENKNEIHNSN